MSGDASGDNVIRDINDLERVIDDLCEPQFLNVLDRSRPYDGQSHTDLGERGKQEIHDITMRDLRDCFIRACYDSSGLLAEQWPKSIYELPWKDMDPLAISQNLTCWVERYMCIYPNVPEIQYDIPVYKLEGNDGQNTNTR